MRRDFYAIARLAPGTTEDAVGPAVLGSTGAENQYIIEGLNTTGIERAERTKQLNFDFVEEIEVKTGGLNAEYGRMTGGVINVITKSGGNTFRGSLFGFNEGGALRSNDSHRGRSAADHDHASPNLDSQWDVGAQRRRLHRQGQAVVLRRLQPRVRADRDDGHPRPDRAGRPGASASEIADVDRDLSLGQADLRASAATSGWCSRPERRPGDA